MPSRQMRDAGCLAGMPVVVSMVLSGQVRAQIYYCAQHERVAVHHSSMFQDGR